MFRSTGTAYQGTFNTISHALVHQCILHGGAFLKFIMHVGVHQKNFFN